MCLSRFDKNDQLTAEAGFTLNAHNSRLKMRRMNAFILMKTLTLMAHSSKPKNSSHKYLTIDHLSLKLQKAKTRKEDHLERIFMKVSSSFMHYEYGVMTPKKYKDNFIDYKNRLVKKLNLIR